MCLADRRFYLGELLSPSIHWPALREVFLSCCESSLGYAFQRDPEAPPSLDHIDDTLSLATGFLLAGAEAVVGSLWSINDLSAAIVSWLYWEERSHGHDRPTALQRSQQRLRTLSGSQLHTLCQTLLQVIQPSIKATQQTLSHLDGTLSRQERQTHPQYRAHLAYYYSLRFGETELQKALQPNSSCQVYFQADRPFANPYHWGALVCYGVA